MKPRNQNRRGPAIQIDATLAEEAVHLAMRGDLAHPYWQKRIQIYETAQADERSGRMAELSRKAFGDLNLDAPMHQALAGQPLVYSSISQCRIIPAGRKRNVGAELFVDHDTPGSSTPTRNLAIRLEAGSFGDPEKLLGLLRRELWYIYDMLDPGFKYDPRLPEAEGGPMHVSLIIRRYRVLWSTVVHGRLVQRGHADPSARDRCAQEFASTFGMLDDHVEEAFTRWFECPRPRHDELLQFARDPVGQFPDLDGRQTSVGICPLCHCPGAIVSAELEPISDPILQDMQRDFPQWNPAVGACSQCYELYRGRLVHNGT